MPSLKKRSLSLYLRNQCQRQFVLYLYNDRERSQNAMPPRQQNRSGLTYVGQAGYEWQNEKVSELKEVFGDSRVHENPNSTGGRPAELSLSEVLPMVMSFDFIIEGAYEADTHTFRQSIGLDDLTDYYGVNVGIGDTRPDVIQVLPPIVDGLGLQTERDPNPYELVVQPNGSVDSLEPNDRRLRLRVIDIKLTSEPGANYFAEVTYYSMTLAAWLIEEGLDNQFVVIAAPAVWPGHHDASELAKFLETWRQQAHEPSGYELLVALEEDLELAVFDIFAPRLRQFLNEEMPDLLSESWSELPWHVDYRCKGCEFLGYPWIRGGETQNHPLHCWPEADRNGHLSRVCGLSRGASEQLRRSGIIDVSSLAGEDGSSEIFSSHQGLRVKRTAFPHRAEALLSGNTSIVPDSGGDALMPRWPDLHIYIFIDYDLSSAITASMAIRAFWSEPLHFGSTLDRQNLNWPENGNQDEVFLVDRRDLERERSEFMGFLRQLAHILNTVRQQDDADVAAGRRDTGRRSHRHRRSTYQIYLWDESQQKHLIRLIGRHLPFILADRQLRDLAWMFPPPELLQQAEDATRQSAITLVKSVVENTVALDVPHYYRLLDLAIKVTPENLSPPRTHPLFEEPLSDLIPMERLHEYWNRVGNWLDKQDNIIRATRSKLYGLSLTVGWLERQLGPLLARQAAPPILQDRSNVRGIAPTSRLWLGFSRLNAALDGLERHTIRAMPPHEREARLRSARLDLRLEGPEKSLILAQLNQSAGTNLIDRPNLFVYQMNPESRDVNYRRGDFLLALSPVDRHGFLDENPYHVTRNTQLAGNRFYGNSIETAGLTAVSIEAIDRLNGIIALKAGNNNIVTQLEEHTDLDFSQDVILDPTHRDFLTKKVLTTLRGIGHPQSASADAHLGTSRYWQEPHVTSSGSRCCVQCGKS